MHKSFETLFLSAHDAAAIVRAHGLSKCLRELAEAIHGDYLRWSSFDLCARVASHTAHGVIELMPIADAQTYSFKYVNGHPRNGDVGLPTVMAFGALADVSTGFPWLICELTLVTALRTAAASVVAARAMARPDSRAMAIIGNGAQSEFQALAFYHLMGIEQVRLFDIDPAATAKLARNLRGASLETVVCQGAQEAVRHADIVTTLTADKARAAILTPEMIEPGMHLNAVGGDCPGKTELHPDVLRNARVVVEYEPQSRVEGEVQQMPRDFPVIELHEVLAGARPGRVSKHDVTVFDSVGFALEDFAAMRFMRERAEALAVGNRVDLVGQAADPRDLYAMISGHGAARLAAESTAVRAGSNGGAIKADVQ